MKHMIYLLGAMAGVACAGCAEMPPDDGDETLGEASAAVSVASNPPGSSSCEGYTAGGGQRVRGKVSIERLISFSDAAGGYYLKYRIGISAQNWKKNIGWNTKPTGQLAIVGEIDDVPCYGFTASCTGFLPVDLGTGGATVRDIGQSWDSEVIGPVGDPNFYDFTARFNLTFHGRDGTSCTL